MLAIEASCVRICPRHCWWKTTQTCCLRSQNAPNSTTDSILFPHPWSTIRWYHQRLKAMRSPFQLLLRWPGYSLEHSPYLDDCIVLKHNFVSSRVWWKVTWWSGKFVRSLIPLPPPFPLSCNSHNKSIFFTMDETWVLKDDIQHIDSGWSDDLIYRSIEVSWSHITN